MQIQRLMGKVAVGIGLAVLAGGAASQSEGFFAKAISAYPDIEFPRAYKEFGFLGASGNGIYKPEGVGPFPAVVLVHTCGGLQPHMSDRAKELVAAGFVVLLLDSYGPRNHTAFCQPTGVGAPRVYKDAFDALKHLATLKEVQPERIYVVGLSLGSFVASTAASPGVAKAAGGEKRFRASVGWYGSCAFTPKMGPVWDLVRPDTDQPLLLLMAKEDKETPIAPCFPLLPEMKAAGKPVAWHVYDNATHGWDKGMPDRGYVLNREVTKDAMAKTIEFLNANQ
ncbi:MAG: dienelactone hydrolase family protein [Comamonadaceae bacterium]|jgi:dienelactone hydrolase|nr:dienelactone hydrolase family protein [Comamonadaceae bacterium]MBN9366407.1 dienelactone hydrolase family protein [Comamonadaceae bacterium]